MDYTKREWRVAETSPISSLVFIKQQDGIIAEASPYYAPLIVTAVNGCQAVNPNNPIVVAESIQDMYAALKELVSEYNVSLPLGDCDYPEYWVKAVQVLAKAEGGD